MVREHEDAGRHLAQHKSFRDDSLQAELRREVRKAQNRELLLGIVTRALKRHQVRVSGCHGSMQGKRVLASESLSGRNRFLGFRLVQKARQLVVDLLVALWRVIFVLQLYRLCGLRWLLTFERCGLLHQVHRLVKRGATLRHDHSQASRGVCVQDLGS